MNKNIDSDNKTNCLDLLDSVLFDNTCISKHRISHIAVFIYVYYLYFTRCIFLIKLKAIFSDELFDITYSAIRIVCLLRCVGP